MEEKFKSPPSSQIKSFENPNKILGVTTHTPLGKISSSRFLLILKQIWMLCLEEISPFPCSFILRVVAPLNPEIFCRYLAGPPFRLFQYLYWPSSIGEIWLYINALMRYMLLRAITHFLNCETWNTSWTSDSSLGRSSW